MRGYLVAGNWKMNGNNAANRALVEGIVAGHSSESDIQLLVCPPFPYLSAVAQALGNSSVALGAQNLSAQESGAFTGEVSGSMLRDVGCQYVIVGHSERRALMGENSGIVAEKFSAALNAGLTPILCVGETLENRQSGQTEAIVGEQINAVLDDAGVDTFENAVIAYEPVWAIGTGMTASPEQAQDVHKYIRGLLAVRDEAVAANVKILYGGSVKGNNAEGLFSNPDIDGGLIGGASLNSDDFLAIAAAAARLN